MNENDIFKLINKYRKEIMALSALWILFYHEWILPATDGSVTYFIIWFIKRLGYTGVDIFLFLSGIGLMYSIQKYNTIDFYKRRLSRVFIPLLLMNIVIALADKLSLLDFIKNIAGITFYTEIAWIDMWFGYAILTLYLVFPVYYKLFSSKNNKYLFTFSCIIVWYVFAVIFTLSGRYDLYIFINRIPIFLIGILAGWVSQNRQFIFTKVHLIICIITLILGIYLGYLSIVKKYILFTFDSSCFLPALFIGLSLTFILAKTFNFIDIKFNCLYKLIRSPLYIIGGASFELYCVQEWTARKILGINEKMNNIVVSNIIKFIIIFVACLMLCYSSKLFKRLLIVLNQALHKK